MRPGSGIVLLTVDALEMFFDIFLVQSLIKKIPSEMEEVAPHYTLLTLFTLFILFKLLYSPAQTVAW